MPLLSIIIPVFNSEKTIGLTLGSLKRISEESGKSVEIVIIDDESTDRSAEIIMSRQDELSPLQVVMVWQKNMGTSGARNTGIERCSGDWIFFLDSDDELAFDPVPFIQKYSDAASIGFAVQYQKDRKPAGTLRPVSVTGENHLDVFTAKNAYTASSIIFRRDRLQVYYDTSFLYLEDWLFWMQNPRIFESMKILSDVMSAIIHSHGGNKSANRVKHGEYRQKVAEKVLADCGSRLNERQKNNLLIQAHIGMLQQGIKISRGIFLSFPCSLLLYMKLIVYYALKGRFASFDVYGS